MLTTDKMLCEPECELDAYLTHTQKKINGRLNNGSKDTDILTPVNVPFCVTRDFSNVVILGSGDKKIPRLSWWALHIITGVFTKPRDIWWWKPQVDQSDGTGIAMGMQVSSINQKCNKGDSQLESQEGTRTTYMLTLVTHFIFCAQLCPELTQQVVIPLSEFKLDGWCTFFKCAIVCYSNHRRPIWSQV